MNFIKQYFSEICQIVQELNKESIIQAIEMLEDTRERGGRLFILGVGGSAANASHAVNDFRKLAGIEAYAPTDNVSEVTARTNDDGWDSVFKNWLKISHIGSDDLVMVFSVGGGDIEKNVSPNLVYALQYAKQMGSRIIGIVGRDGGFTSKVSNVCIIIPTVNLQNVTPHTEGFQVFICHLLVSHPRLKVYPTKW
jgi:D-sedoheptulose 7-phosphate isomerase